MNDETGPRLSNKILNAIPADRFAEIEPLFKKVDLPHGKVLTRPDEQIEYVYFPENSMISIVPHTEGGLATEVAVIGSEGAVGLSVLMGMPSTPYENMVQLPNGGLRISAKDLQREFARGGELQDKLLQFTQMLMIQISQTSLCNRLHTVEKRFSKWLLMCDDRSKTESLMLTQEFLAMMLGSNRTTVTLTALELQKRGLISYTRAKIKILDRTALEAFSCSCYKIIRDAYKRN